MQKKHGISLYLVVSVLCVLVSQVHSANAKDNGTGMMAPTWGKTEWINLPQGKKTLDIEDYRGRVVYLALFQQW